MKAADAKKTLEKQYKRQNEYIRSNYDRVSVTLPKGTKDQITATGESLNGFINQAIADRLESIQNKPKVITEN